LIRWFSLPLSFLLDITGRFYPLLRGTLLYPRGFPRDVPAFQPFPPVGFFPSRPPLFLSLSEEPFSLPSTFHDVVVSPRVPFSSSSARYLRG